MNKGQRKYLQQIVGLSLIAVILLMGMASAHPGLHQALHQNSSCSEHCNSHNEGDHEDAAHLCGVTLLQTGAILFIDQPILEALGQLRVSIDRYDDKPQTLVSFGLPMGRAPPIAGIV